MLSSCILRSRASQWASHFEITDVNKDLKAGEAYTYDLEWSPDAVKPPIKQKVRAVPPAYIEYAPHPARLAQPGKIWAWPHGGGLRSASAGSEGVLHGLTTEVKCPINSEGITEDAMVRL